VNASDGTSYAASWYVDTMVPAPARAALAFDLDVDVCVVGGGLAGLTVAREIARRGWSVVLLEARRIAWNASGRNCGFVIPGFAETMDNVVRRVGLDHAKSLWALSEAGVEYVRNTIRGTGMPGIDPTDGWLKVSKADDAEHDLALIKLYGQELGADIEGWPTERVRAVLKSDHYFHGIHLPRAFTIHPLNYALGLAAAAEAAGVRIFEDTPVLSIDPAGVRKRIVTPSARLRASHIVLAGNVHLGALLPRLSGTLVPMWTYMVTTQRLGPRLEEAISYRGGVTDTDMADNHYRIVGGDRLLWSGRMTTWEADPKWFVKKLQTDLQALYPQLGKVEIEHAWSGVMGYALHRMPQIGEFSPGMWIASGFGGHGLNTTAMAGTVVARGITEGDDQWRLFLPFEFVWAGGAVGRAAMQVYYWWVRSRERSKGRAARKREQEYRLTQAREGQESEPELERAAVQPDTAEPTTLAPQPTGAMAEDAVEPERSSKPARSDHAAGV
jgi:gamma-glutamylputrescine oxidase